MKSLEERLFVWANRHVPKPIFRYLPSLYYWVNQFRFKIFKRPIVPRETSKARARRQREGFFQNYANGRGMDIGHGGDLLTPSTRGWDIENGDAHYMRGVADNSLDYVYSSHLLEHMRDAELAVKNWWRVVKQGGYLILYVPDRDLAERKKTLPSDLSLDHKRFFVLDQDEAPDTVGLIPLCKRVIPEAKLVYAKVCTDGYRQEETDPTRQGECSIEAVFQKI